VHRLVTPAGVIDARYVVNAAGLAADTVDHLFGHGDLTITPRRGRLLVFDKFASWLPTHILLPGPCPAGKGVLVAPTVVGNVLVAPSSEAVSDRWDTPPAASGPYLTGPLGSLSLSSRRRSQLPTRGCGLPLSTPTVSWAPTTPTATSARRGFAPPG